MTASVCSTSYSQMPFYRRLLKGAPFLEGVPAPTVGHGISSAVDLPSLIRTVNAISDTLRSLTTSLTVNNLYKVRPAWQRAEGDTNYSEYPVWRPTQIETVRGDMYHRDKAFNPKTDVLDPTALYDDQKHKIDPEQRAYVQRVNRIVYQNATQDDPEFSWRYTKKLDYYIVDPVTGELLS